MNKTKVMESVIRVGTFIHFKYSDSHYQKHFLQLTGAH